MASNHLRVCSSGWVSPMRFIRSKARVTLKQNDFLGSLNKVQSLSVKIKSKVAPFMTCLNSPAGLVLTNADAAASFASMTLVSRLVPASPYGLSWRASLSIVASVGENATHALTCCTIVSMKFLVIFSSNSPTTPLRDLKKPLALLISFNIAETLMVI